MNQEKQRWKYRFDNFKRAYFLLQEAVAKNSENGLEQLAKEGMIQRFDQSKPLICMELAWKTMKDYLEFKNFVFTQITPNAVIKEAFAAKLIQQGEDWLEALDARNKISHTYNFEKFEKVIENIKNKYLGCFGELYEKLALGYDK